MYKDIKAGCWGAGKLAKESVRQIMEVGISIEFFIDSDDKKWSSKFEGYSVIGPMELEEKNSEVDMILITTGYWENIFRVCMELGIAQNKVKYWDCKERKMFAYEEMYLNNIYSQNGEEIFLKEKFVNKEKGFYVDVGSFHPFYFSNTYWAYKRGWNGINIEPNIENFKLFELFRPKDININCGISEDEGIMKYYQFEEAALNTFNRDVVEFYENVRHKEVKEVLDVEVRRLDNILREKNIKKIDFLDIDVEGAEMDVLRTIDFNIDIESILLEQGRHASLQDILNSEENRFLRERGYEAINKCGITVIYEKQRMDNMK